MVYVCMCFFLSFVLQLLMFVAVFDITLHAWNSGAEQAKKLRDFGVFMFDFPLENHSIVSSLLWFRLWRQMIWILCIIASHSAPALRLYPSSILFSLRSAGCCFIAGFQLQSMLLYVCSTVSYVWMWTGGK